MTRHTRRPVALVLVALGLVAGCGGATTSGSAATPTTAGEPARPIVVTLRHHFTPNDGSGIGRDNDDEGSACGVSGLTRRGADLAHMDPNAEVLLRDGDGSILAKTTLGNGRTSNVQRLGDPAAGDFRAEFDCSWTVTFDPADATFFQVDVAGQTLGTLSATEAHDPKATIDI